MSCCACGEMPAGWDPLPVADDKIPAALAQDIQTNMKLGRGMPSEYRACLVIRVGVIALLIIGISAGAMTLEGTLTTFPESVMHFFQNVNWIHAAPGIGIFVVMTVGAGIVIYQAQHQIDKHTESASKGFTGDSQWVSALYQSDSHGYHPGYIDTSTLDEKGNGYAYMYAVKDEQGHYTVSAVVSAVTPLYLAATVIYNLIRIVILPLYIIGCLLYENHTGEPIEADRPFTATDILWETGKSLWRIVKAPFYALAFVYAGIYSLFDPLNGRKLGSYIERDWNEKVTRAEGYWSVGGPQPLWLWEGGGLPSTLGRNGFYLAGCWQPIARVHYHNGIKTGESLSRAVNPAHGHTYTIHTAADTHHRHNQFITQLQPT